MGEEGHVADRRGLVWNPKGRDPYENIRVCGRTVFKYISRQ